MITIGRSSITALASFLIALAGGPAPSASPIRLDADLSDRVLKIVQGDKVVKTYEIAVGRPGHPTPPGSYTTGQIEWNPSWTPPDADWAKNNKPQPPGAKANPLRAVKIYFKAPDYYIHGTNDPGSIGEAASHGCIRMTATDATDLASRIEQAGGKVPLVIHP